MADTVAGMMISADSGCSVSPSSSRQISSDPSFSSLRSRSSSWLPWAQSRCYGTPSSPESCSATSSRGFSSWGPSSLPEARSSSPYLEWSQKSPTRSPSCFSCIADQASSSGSHCSLRSFWASWLSLIGRRDDSRLVCRMFILHCRLRKTS